MNTGASMIIFNSIGMNFKHDKLTKWLSLIAFLFSTFCYIFAVVMLDASSKKKITAQDLATTVFMNSWFLFATPYTLLVNN